MTDATGMVGVVLAGGRSTRMGGRDKAFLRLGQDPLVAWALRRMARAVPGAVAVNSNAAASLFQPFGRPILPDRVPGWPGPLAGIHAGLRWALDCGATRLFTAPVDTLFYPLSAPADLAAAAEPGVIVVSATNTRRHPVVSLWPVALHADLERHLARGGSRRVNDFIDRHPHREVEFAPPPSGCDPFFNINTPDDLLEAERLLEQGAH